MENLEDTPEKKRAEEALRQMTEALEQANRRLTVEAALERVRAVALRMRRSEDLSQAATTMFKELKGLGLPIWRGSFLIIDETSDPPAFEVWGSTAEGKTIRGLKLPIPEHPVLQGVYAAWQHQKDIYVDELAGEVRKNWIHFLIEKGVPAQESEQWDMVRAYHAIFTYGILLVVTPDRLSEEDLNVLRRFRDVFAFAYTRFLDLQDAEKRARDAQVEAALERVRAVALGMKKSEDLSQAGATVFQELKSLGLPIWRGGFGIMDEVSDPLSIEMWGLTVKGTIIRGVRVPFFEGPSLPEFYAAWKRQEDTYVIEWTGDTLKDFLQHLGKFGYPADWPEQWDTYRVYYAFFTYGSLYVVTPERLSDEDVGVIRRFRDVFAFAYARFLDLQDAEKRARDAQVEAALERVRAVALGMKSSEDLTQAGETVFQELKRLGLPIWRGGFGIVDETSDSPVLEVRGLTARGTIIPGIRIPFAEHPLFQEIYAAWKRRDDTYVNELTGDALKDYFQFLGKFGYPADWSEQSVTFHGNVAFFTYGVLYANTSDRLSEEYLDVLRRFRDVFAFAYTRFLDLQDAERRAREAQVEAALERVRVAALGMKSSEDFSQAGATVNQELKRLGFPIWRGGFCIMDETSDPPVLEAWGLTETGTVIRGFRISVASHPVFQEIYVAWKRREDIFTYELSGDALKDYHQFLQEMGYPTEGLNEWVTFHGNVAFFANGILNANTPARLSEEDLDVFRRFRDVFAFAYARFLDLQDAEKRAHESQVEAALERVRSAALGMKSSEDLSQTATKVFQELKGLVPSSWRGGFEIVDEASNPPSFIIWGETAKGTVIPGYRLPITLYSELQEMYASWKRQDDTFTSELSGDRLKDYNQFLQKRGYPSEWPDQWMTCYFYMAIFTYGFLYVVTPDRLFEEDLKVLRRFRDGFAFAYARFLDLQDAERRAREAQVEAALERVRTKALGMHESEELAQAAVVVFRELRGLGFHMWRCGFGIIDEESDTAELWYTTAQGEAIQKADRSPLTGHPVSQGIYEAWKRKDAFCSFDLSGDDLVEWVRFILESGGQFPEWRSQPADALPKRWIGYCVFFSHGYMYVSTLEPLSGENIDSLQKFAGVFSLAYTRSLDLQEAETRAREAVRQSAVDRVRAEIAAMRTSADLDQVTPLLWKELTAVGVSFLRCGMFIVNEQEERVRVYLANPSGAPLAAMNPAFDSIPIIREAVQHWRERSVYTTQWDRQTFLTTMQALIAQGQPIEPEQYLDDKAPPESLTLQLVPFTQGMLYVGSAEALPEEDIELMQSLANAFSVAYARYQDFQKLEAQNRALEKANQEVRQALTEKEQAQEMLVRSESMAAIGTLVAGVAHELNNPLGAASSLVQSVQEMIEEDSAEEFQQDKATILDHLSFSRREMNRIRDIVASLLGLSRQTNDYTEPVKLDVVSKDALRVLYNKYKRYEVNVEEDYQEGLPQIQGNFAQLGQVCLNIIQNAIEAVGEGKGKIVLKTYGERESGGAEEQRGGEDSHAPLHPGSPAGMGEGYVVFECMDTGPGMSEEVKRDIFKPFFTTKAPGKGTGLGLYLCHQIVEKHKGTIEVDSAPGKGTTFSVRLPLTR